MFRLLGRGVDDSLMTRFEGLQSQCLSLVITKALQHRVRLRELSQIQEP